MSECLGGFDGDTPRIVDAEVRQLSAPHEVINFASAQRVSFAKLVNAVGASLYGFR
jgi:hypothetical protein